MPDLTTLKATKKLLMRGVFGAAMAALIGVQGTGLAAQGRGLWSIVVHFQYADGFEFDYVIERGVSTEDVGAALAECGQSHWTGSVVRYHCFPVPE
jgi:hypothetical protein